MKTSGKARIFLFSFFAVAAAVYIMGVLYWGGLRAKPSPDWEARAKKAKVVVAMGFGIVRGADNKPHAGKSNEGLYNRISKYSPETVVAQQGIVLAAESENCRAAAQKLKTASFVPMHPHDSKHYVDTLAAARSALKTIGRMNEDPRLDILVIAKEEQLKRAAADLRGAAKTNPRWRNFTFIVPETDPVSFDEKSDHLHTRSKFLYTLVEIFLSRPRDFIHLAIARNGVAAVSAGFILFIAYPVVRRRLTKKGSRIGPEDEDKALSFFILSNTGLWILLFSSIILLDWHGVVSIPLNLLSGAAIGFIAGLRSFSFWGNTDQYARKPALGEPIGAVGMGCFLLFADVALGMLAGFVL